MLSVWGEETSHASHTLITNAHNKNTCQNSNIVTYAKSRPLREEMYRAYMNRASSGATDNTPVINKLLALRREGAQLLGFDNFAERSMTTKVGVLCTLCFLWGVLRALRRFHNFADSREQGTCTHAHSHCAL